MAMSYSFVPPAIVSLPSFAIRSPRRPRHRIIYCMFSLYRLLMTHSMISPSLHYQSCTRSVYPGHSSTWIRNEFTLFFSIGGEHVQDWVETELGLGCVVIHNEQERRQDSV